MESVVFKPLCKSPDIIFMGTPEFAVPSLRSLHQRGYHIKRVITQPDRPKGRGRRLTPSAVKIEAERLGLELIQPERLIEDLINDADLIIVVAFGRVIKKEFLIAPGYGIINVHPSLLPRYRGAAPIQWAIMNNEKETGISIIKMEEGLDSGPILYQKRVKIREDESAGELSKRLAEESASSLLEFLGQWQRGVIVGRIQDDSEATFAPKITKDMKKVDWNESARKVSSKIRALDPAPGATTLLNDVEIKLFRARLEKEGVSGTVPGRVKVERGRMLVDTIDGIVEIRELQYPGRKRIRASEFIKGYRISDGLILGSGKD